MFVVADGPGRAFADGRAAEESAVVEGFCPQLNQFIPEPPVLQPVTPASRKQLKVIPTDDQRQEDARMALRPYFDVSRRADKVAKNANSKKYLFPETNESRTTTGVHGNQLLCIQLHCVGGYSVDKTQTAQSIRKVSPTF
ncbi:MAG: hypothetical protein CMJ64_17080 [Planctomycetaceae bacterium]|nr:hypothetical protein [Planctomycetaceae bacterium]